MAFEAKSTDERLSSILNARRDLEREYTDKKGRVAVTGLTREQYVELKGMTGYGGPVLRTVTAG